MATNVNFPKSGMGIAEGTIARWHKKVGDRVREGEVIVEIETAKAIDEVTATVSGVLSSIRVNEGEVAEVNSILGVIDESTD